MCSSQLLLFISITITVIQLYDRDTWQFLPIVLKYKDLWFVKIFLQDAKASVCDTFFFNNRIFLKRLCFVLVQSSTRPSAYGQMWFLASSWQKIFLTYTKGDMFFYYIGEKNDDALYIKYISFRSWVIFKSIFQPNHIKFDLEFPSYSCVYVYD